MRQLCCIFAIYVGFAARNEQVSFIDLGPAPSDGSLSILTWNVENFGRKSLGPKEDYVHGHLQYLYREHKPAIFVLQEVESCSIIQKFFTTRDYGCVTTTVPQKTENDTPNVLGNVVLYSQTLFVASNENRVQSEGTEHLAHQVTPVSGRSLQDHWKEECEKWRAYNDCRSVVNDIPRPTSVLLTLRTDTGLWKDGVLAAFTDGLRIVDVHLFSGGRQAQLTDQGRRERRKFQMRALLAMVTVWNRFMQRVPTTIYAGDFNTRGDLELRYIAAPGKDYGLKLWCPANGQKNDRSYWDCYRTKSQHATSKAGFLDNFIVDLKPERSLAGWIASAAVLKQQPNSQQRSDHEPLLLKLQPPAAKAPATGVSWPGLVKDIKKPTDTPSQPQKAPATGVSWSSLVKDIKKPTETPSQTQKTPATGVSWPGLVKDIKKPTETPSQPQKTPATGVSWSSPVKDIKKTA